MDGLVTGILAHFSSQYCLLRSFSGWIYGHPPSSNISLQYFPYWHLRGAGYSFSLVCYMTRPRLEGLTWYSDSTSIFLLARLSTIKDCNSVLFMLDFSSIKTEQSSLGFTVSAMSISQQSIVTFFASLFWLLLLLASSRHSLTLSSQPSIPLKFLSRQLFLCVPIQLSYVPRKGQSLARHFTIESATKLAAMRSGCLTQYERSQILQVDCMMHLSQKV